MRKSVEKSSIKSNSAGIYKNSFVLLVFKQKIHSSRLRIAEPEMSIVLQVPAWLYLKCKQFHCLNITTCYLKKATQLNIPFDKHSALVTVQWFLRLSKYHGINKISR